MKKKPQLAGRQTNNTYLSTLTTTLFLLASRALVSAIARQSCSKQKELLPGSILPPSNTSGGEAKSNRATGTAKTGVHIVSWRDQNGKIHFVFAGRFFCFVFYVFFSFFGIRQTIIITERTRKVSANIIVAKVSCPQRQVRNFFDPVRTTGGGTELKGVERQAVFDEVRALKSFSRGAKHEKN